jgi:uncharacterized protein (DUF362 family)
MKRREFIKKTGQAAALAAVSGGVGFLFHNRESTAYAKLIQANPAFQVAADPSLPKVVLARNTDHIAALNAALDAVGGIKRFVKPGEKVTVKPNIGWDRTPEQGADTNPILVGEMVRLCLEAGASEVVVTDIPCNFAPRCFLRSGIKEAVEKAGGKVILPRDEDLVTVDLKGKMLTDWPVLKHFINTDRLINMPIVKNHSLSRSTVGMKNLSGVLGGFRNRLHQQIDQSIVDLASFFTPTLVVVDATRVMMRGGPTGGSLDDVKIENSVMCATDQVAADARAVEFLDMQPDKIGHIVLAQKSGLGAMDYKAAGYKELG